MTSEQPSKPVNSQAPRHLWRENAQVLLIAVLMALLIRAFVAEPRYIPSDSMTPTLQIGDRLVIEKVSYYFHPPKFGDIVVFEPPPQLQRLGYAKDQAFIKRVIGQPGETVYVRGGKVYVNDRPLTEPYIAAPPDYILAPSQVPADAYFVMGDNRNNSNDSHVWGFLPRKNIIGHAWLRFWTFDRVGWVK